MTDPLWLVVWCAVLLLGVGTCLALRRFGVAATHVRDLLHVGAGIWVFGWPLWHSATAPIGLAVLVALATGAIPIAGRRWARVRRFAGVFAEGDEAFGGLVLYGVAYASLTVAAFECGFFPAAAGLLALSLGDGIGGAVGLAAGRHRFRPPRGKEKSIEGSAAVALASALGIAIAGWRFGAEIGIGATVGLAALASVTEAVAPRGTDNLLLPTVVWGAARGLSA